MKRLLWRLFPRKTESLEEFIELLQRHDCVSIRTKTFCRRFLQSEIRNTVEVKGILELRADLRVARSVKYQEVKKEEISQINRRIIEEIEAQVKAFLRQRLKGHIPFIKEHLALAKIIQA